MSYFKGLTVLVTGAAGSIGSEVVKELLMGDCDKVIALDSSEHGLYQLKRKFSGYPISLKAVLGDVTDDDGMLRVFTDYKPRVVIHAAAYKHVAMCEENRYAAWRVNIFGTRTVLKFARSHGSDFILVSTDKAVAPTSYMGMTKRCAEQETREVGETVIRLTNVFGSSGSVVPLWQEQIAKGEHVTLTDLYATRWFIGADFAAKMVLACVSLAPSVFVAKLGILPANLYDLAKQLGATKFRLIGLQPGEKLEEELTTGKLVETHVKGLYREIL